MKPAQCPSCKNIFHQPFLCITCGAEKLYDATLKAAQSDVAKLMRRIKRLEQEISFAREMMLPDQISVYKAAMRYAKPWSKADVRPIILPKEKRALLLTCIRARGGK